MDDFKSPPSLVSSSYSKREFAELWVRWGRDQHEIYWRAMVDSRKANPYSK